MVARKKKVVKVKTDEISDVIEDVVFHEQFKADFVEYGLYSISDRAVPDVRDGLKPGARRLIYGMNELGATASNKYLKSARITGDVMGKYHPHGDSALYESLTHLAQWWRSPITPVDGDGNWGNVQGMDAAADRYTEARLSKLGMRFVKRLRKGVVPYVSNYSNDLDEPTVLPVDFPYLLIAGGTGNLTVAINANIPPHNPREVMAAVIAYIKNPKISDEKLFEILPGPDFPTGGVIYNASEALEYYKTGKFSFKVRGAVERDKKGIVITEVPFTSSGKVKALQVSIDDMIRAKRIGAGTQARNYTNKHGIKIEVGLRSGSTLDELESELFAKTGLQSKYHATWVALKNRVPKVFNLRDYLSEYVDFQYQVLEDISKTDLARLSKDLEIQNGLHTALDHIDVIIELIRNAKKESDILKCLTSGVIPAGVFKLKKSEKTASSFSFSEPQAEYILNTRLKRLSNLDRVALEKRIAAIQKEIARLEKVINDPAAAKRELIKQQQEVAKIFEDPEFERKTRLVDEDDIIHTEVKKVVNYELSLDKFGYTRLLTPNAASVSNEVARLTTDSEKRVGFFASDGSYYSIKVGSMKQSTAKDRGDTLASLVKLPGTAWPILDSFGEALGDGRYVLVTAHGLIKSTEASEYESSRTKLAGPKLKGDDELVAALNAGTEKFLVLVTSAGRAKRLKISDVPHLSRTASGNQSGRLLDGERVVAAYLGDTTTKFKVGDKVYKFSDVSLDKTTTAFKALK